MNQEIIDFNHFKENTLYSVDFTTGTIATSINKHDVGSKNPDGYIRLWCNKSLRMKHRLIYFLKYNVLPEVGSEIDHIDGNRSNNVITNLRILTKGVNNLGTVGKHGKQMTLDTVHKVCRLLADTDLSDTAIAKIVGKSRATIRDIKVRRSRTKISCNYSWEHRGY